MALVLTRLVRSNYDELDNIPIIHQDLTASFTKQADTYYIHTGSTTSAYTKGRMYYCDGTNLKKVVIVDELPKVNDGKLTITVNGTAHTFTANQSGNTSFSITDTNTSHSHSAGIGLVGSGNAGTSNGTYNYKAKLRSETALTVDSVAATTTSGRVYPVAVDKSGYLSVNVPWNDTNSTYDAGTGLNLSHGVFSAKLNNTASLGTIGTTSKLYAVGVDANGKLCVKVPWTDTNTIKSAALSDNILTLELG